MRPALPNRSPQLAPPGAGLPVVELFFARTLFSTRRTFTSNAAAERIIADQGAVIAHLATHCRADLVAQRVLIDRLPGLEDSSRFWSIAMTPDHLRIVNLRICGNDPNADGG